MKTLTPKEFAAHNARHAALAHKAEREAERAARAGQKAALAAERIDRTIARTAARARAMLATLDVAVVELPPAGQYIIWQELAHLIGARLAAVAPDQQQEND